MREENEQLREECIELRDKSKRAWELEVRVRELTQEVEKLKAEIARRKEEEEQQRKAYVEALKSAEDDAKASQAANEVQAVAAAVAAQNADWEARMAAAKAAQDTVRIELESELKVARERIVDLEKEAAASALRRKELEAAAQKAISPPSPPAPSSNGSEDVARLEAELAQAQRIIGELRKKLAELTKVATPNPADDDGKEGFGAFIEMKRENQVLRAQIKDLMRTQQRILGGSSARRVEPGRGLRRKGRR